jgi:hypothetical protein
MIKSCTQGTDGTLMPKLTAPEGTKSTSHGFDLIARRKALLDASTSSTISPLHFVPVEMTGNEAPLGT